MFGKVIKKYISKINIKLHGFSIIEMMIVLIIIGIIATISISTLNNALLKAKIKAAQIQAYNLSRSLDIYKLQFGKYPDEKDGWSALVSPPDGIPLLEKIPIDPWNNQFIYLYPGEHNLSNPDIISRGPDGKFSNDDIGNWEN